MSLNMDSEVITLTCSHCSIQYEETVSRLKYEPKLCCPNCGENIAANLLDLYSTLESVQKCADALLKKLVLGSDGKSLR